MPDQGSDDKKKNSSDASRQSAMERARGIFRSAETLNRNAAARVQRDEDAFNPVTDWRQIPTAMKARFARNVERSIFQPFGTVGEAIFQSRRAPVGQKLQAASNVIKLSVMSSLGGRSVIGEYFANKISSTINYTDDPNQIVGDLHETQEAISHELLTINNRFQLTDRTIEDIKQQFIKVGEKNEAKLKEHTASLKSITDRLDAKENESLENTIKVEKTFTTMERRFVRIERDIVALKNRISGIERRKKKQSEEFEPSDPEFDFKPSDDRLAESKRERRRHRRRKDFEAADFKDKDTAVRAPKRKLISPMLEKMKGLPNPSNLNFGGLLTRSLLNGVTGIASFAALRHPLIVGGLLGGSILAKTVHDFTTGTQKPREPIPDDIHKKLNEQRDSAGKSEANKLLEKLEGEKKRKDQGPLFMFGQGRVSKNVEDQRGVRSQLAMRQAYADDFLTLYQAQKREEDKKQFMMFGKLPGGFEFMPGHMGRLGMPSAVAATGAMPLGGYGGSGGFGGGSAGSYGGSSGGSYFPGERGFNSAVPLQPPERPTDFQKPGATNIGRSNVGVDVGQMKIDSRGYVKPEQYYQAALQKLEGSKLIGFVPEDGKKFGITTGSKEEWARFMTQLTKQESSFKVTTVGDGGSSHGLSQMKAGQYGIKDPYDPHQAQSGMIKQFEQFVLKSGSIAGTGTGPGTYQGYKGVAAYFGPLRRQHEFFQHDEWMKKMRPKLDEITTGLPQLSLFDPEKLKDNVPQLSLLPKSELDKVQEKKAESSDGKVEPISQKQDENAFSDFWENQKQSIRDHSGKLNDFLAKNPKALEGLDDSTINKILDTQRDWGAKGKDSTWTDTLAPMMRIREHQNQIKERAEIQAQAEYEELQQTFDDTYSSTDKAIMREEGTGLSRSKWIKERADQIARDEIGKMGKTNIAGENLAVGRKENFYDEHMEKLANGNASGMQPISMMQAPEKINFNRSVVPSEFGIPKNQPLDLSRIKQNQMNEARVRKLPISPRLEKVLGYAAEKAGVEVEIISGGQGRIGSGRPRVGSTRHDDGNAADLDLYITENGKRRKLSENNPNDVRIMSEFTKQARSAGATGIGGGKRYMSEDGSRLHVGFGKEAVWGPDRTAATAPGWLKNSMAEGILNSVNVNDFQAKKQSIQTQPEEQSIVSTDKSMLADMLPKTKGPVSFVEHYGLKKPDMDSKDGSSVAPTKVEPVEASSISPESAGFTKEEAQPVASLDTIAGVSPTPQDVPAPSPDKPVIAEATEAPAATEKTDFTNARSEEQPEGGSRSSAESTDARVPQGGGRYNPESEGAKPGSSGYGASGRCFVALFCISIGISALFLERTNIESYQSTPIIQTTDRTLPMLVADRIRRETSYNPSLFRWK